MPLQSNSEYQHINETEAADHKQHKHDKELLQERIDKDQGLDKGEEDNG